MREVLVSDGRKFTVRAMTRKEIREGKDLGFGYVAPGLSLARFDEALDYAVDRQLVPAITDELGNDDVRALFKAILAETYGDPGEEKNLSRSGSDSQTPSE
jgi:hypothetical protein